MKDEFVERARQRLPEFAGFQTLPTGNLIGPIEVSAMSLGGKAPVTWGSEFSKILKLEVYRGAAPGASFFSMSCETGWIKVYLEGVAGYALYVECFLSQPAPNLVMRWEAAVTPLGGESGTMSRSGSNFFFATPPVSGRDDASLHVMQQSPPRDPNDSWIIEKMTILGVEIPGAAT